MKFKFERLLIWQKAMKFGEEIFLLASTFPSEENYNLKSQITRAADSIALNIAEGSIGQSGPEKKIFIGYSIRSLAEVITCLYKAKTRKYCSDEEFRVFYDDGYYLMNMMIAYRNKL